MSFKFYTLITGATGGIGKEFAKQLAKQGDNLILTSKSQDKLVSLKSELLAINNSIDIVTFACNLLSENNRVSFFEYIQNNNLKIDKLINVAGVDTQKKFEKYTQDKLIFQIRVVFESVASITLFALQNRVKNLKVLTISSMCGIMPIPYFAVYSSQKMALISFFDALRIEYKKDKNVHFTTILPGSVPTRDDIILDIKKQGLSGKLSKKSPNFVVKKSLKALDKNKKNYVPGFYNKLVYFTQKITPKFIALNFMAKKFKNKEKDAY